MRKHPLITPHLTPPEAEFLLRALDEVPIKGRSIASLLVSVGGKVEEAIRAAMAKREQK